MDRAKERQAAGALPAEQADQVKFLNLAAVPVRTRNMTDPQFTVHFKGYVARSSVLGAVEISEASGARNLASPTPPALEIHASEESGNVLYGVPTMEKSDSHLLLDWEEKGRRVKTNMIHLLQAKKLQIPADTRMVIRVEHVKHATLGPCVKLSWTSQCFVPISEMAEEESEQAE